MNSRTSTALIALSLIATVAGAQSTQPVEWKVSEGGNGHWYQGVRRESFMTWSEAKQQALAASGGLLSVGTQAESEWVFANVVADSRLWAMDGPYIVGPWLGGRGASGLWRWDDGTPWSYAAWLPGEGPPSPDPQEQFAHYFGGFGSSPTPVNGWGDYFDVLVTPSFVIEWSTDCNNDGIVDYGQILRGELEDLNSNGVPDICETSISSVLPPSVPAQGGSTITIRGIGFPANPTVLIGGVPATNVVRESLTRITATSPAVMPGMKSVSVNGFTLPDGIYIRPECGSDLDQDGEVTAADIAIVLLDFGPCYSNAANTQPDDSTPFLLKDQPASAVIPQPR